MKKYRVGIKISGYVERRVEAEDEDEAQEIAIDRIDWGDVELFCEKCCPVEEYACKVKGEN